VARVTTCLDESTQTDISQGRLNAYADRGAAESHEEVGGMRGLMEFYIERRRLLRVTTRYGCPGLFRFFGRS